jgi:DNA mismatch endonuclease (patch repair protein)
MDNLSNEKRSKIMKSIKHKNTRPEIKVRAVLRHLRIGYRLSGLGLPGKPDIVMKGRKCVIFVNGCFWHKHDCKIFKNPSSRVEYWAPKLERNVERDKERWGMLASQGWRVIVVWECALQGNESLSFEAICNQLNQAILGTEKFIEIRGEARISTLTG